MNFFFSYRNGCGSTELCALWRYCVQYRVASNSGFFFFFQCMFAPRSPIHYYHPSLHLEWSSPDDLHVQVVLFCLLVLLVRIFFITAELKQVRNSVRLQLELIFGHFSSTHAAFETCTFSAGLKTMVAWRSAPCFYFSAASEPETVIAESIFIEAFSCLSLLLIEWYCLLHCMMAVWAN